MDGWMNGPTDDRTVEYPARARNTDRHTEQQESARRTGSLARLYHLEHFSKPVAIPATNGWLLRTHHDTTIVLSCSG